MTSLVSSCQKWLLTQSTWRGNDSDKGPQINSISKRVVFILSRGLSRKMGMRLMRSIYFASKLTRLLESNPCISVSYQILLLARTLTSQDYMRLFEFWGKMI